MHRAGFNKENSNWSIAQLTLRAPHLRPQRSSEHTICQKKSALMRLTPVCPTVGSELCWTKTLCSQEPDPEAKETSSPGKQMCQVPHLPRTCCLPGYQHRAQPSFLCYCSALTTFLITGCGNYCPDYVACANRGRTAIGKGFLFQMRGTGQKGAVWGLRLPDLKHAETLDENAVYGAVL